MIKARLLSFLAWFILSLWSRSVSIRFVHESIRDDLRDQGKNFIYAFWHGNMFLLLHANRKSGVLIPVSESADGDIMAELLKRFRYRVVRGSSSRNGHKALLGMICGARRGGTLGVAVDGPKGPVHEAKRGAVFLAGKMRVPIIPVAAAARRFWVIESTWEKLMIPAPFTHGVVVFGEPLFINGVSDEAIESGRKRLEYALRNLSQHARAEANWSGSPEREQAFGT